MSYTKQTWANGDIITAAKLNHMEDGIAGVEADVSSLNTQLLASMPHDTASGSIASFPDGAAMPIRDLSVDIEPVQAGSGDPSPDNVRPISGWTEAKVTRTGKNLLPTGLSAAATGNATVTPTQSGGYVLSATANSSWLWARINTILARPLAGKRVVFSFNIEIDHDQNPQTIFSLRKADGTVIISKTASYSQDRNLYIDIPADVEADSYLAMTLYVTTSTSVQVGWKTTYTDLQMEIVDSSVTTPTSYESYQGQTYTIDLDGTRYGGTLDVTSGKLTITHNGVSVTGANVANVYSSPLPYVTVNVAGVATSLITDTTGGAISDTLTLYRYTSASGHENTFYFNNGVMYIREPTFIDTTDKNSAISSLNNSPVFVVYPLATPIEVDLTPTEITTLLGTNNIWADAGDTTVDYYADTTLFVNKKIAAAVASLS